MKNVTYSCLRTPVWYMEKNLSEGSGLLRVCSFMKSLTNLLFIIRVGPEGLG
jgi:hypothetical protein